MARTTDRPAGQVAVALLGLALAAGLILGAQPASACSCVRMHLGSRLPEADGAFVGTYVDRSEIGDGRAAFTFDVERVVKDVGPTAIVRTNATGGPCGLEFYGDRRAGLLLRHAEDGVWGSDLCSMVQPSELLAVGGAHPPDPDVAAVSAGWSTATKSIAIGAGVVLFLVVALLLIARVARRGTSRPIEPV
jgi:hypothetical protein